MATLADILSPQDRIAGLDQTPVQDPLAPAMLAGLTDQGPGPKSYAPPVTPRTPTLASRNVYGPSRIQGEQYGSSARTAPLGTAGDPNAGLAQRIAQLATSPDAAPTGFLATKTGSALRGALFGLGQNLPPTARGLGGFLGSGARAFTSTVDAMQAGQAQQAQARAAATEAQQRDFTTGLNNRLTQARIDDLTSVDPAKPVLYQGGPGQQPGWTTPGTDGQPPTFTPLPGVKPRPVSAPGGGVNPLDTKYGQVLDQVRRSLTLGLPTYATPEAQEAEAQRRMTQQYGRSPGFTAWSQSAWGGGGRNGGGPSGGRIPVTQAELQKIQSQHPGVDVSAYYTVTDQ